MKVEVALIPAAGRGTRMRPATNAVPKALLTVADRPSIQWVVEEAVRSGVTEVVMVVDSDAGAMIERHFDMGGHLPRMQGVEVRSVVQEEAKGLGHAVLVGREAVGDRPFYVLTADDLIRPHEAVLPSLADAAGRGVSVVCVRELPEEVLTSKGVITPGPHVEDGVLEVTGAVEKPPSDEMPSPYGIQGRYLFMPEVFDVLEGIEPGFGGEIQLTDAIDALGGRGRCRAYVTRTEILDTGYLQGFLHATFAMASAHREYGKEFKAMMRNLLTE